MNCLAEGVTLQTPSSRGRSDKFMQVWPAYPAIEFRAKSCALKVKLKLKIGKGQSLNNKGASTEDI